MGAKSLPQYGISPVDSGCKLVKFLRLYCVAANL